MLNVVDDDARVAAPLTWRPVKFDGAEPPHSWMLRKYVCVVFGVAQLSSEPIECQLKGQDNGWLPDLQKMFCVKVYGINKCNKD
jgi:hypothetical protein